MTSTGERVRARTVRTRPLGKDQGTFLALHSQMIDFAFTFNGKAYQASATDVVNLTGDTQYHVSLKDSNHDEYLKQPVLTKFKKGGYGWPTSSFVIETEFNKAAAMALIQVLKSKSQQLI